MGNYGSEISKRYPYKSQPKAVKLFLTFLPSGTHKTKFGIFEILKAKILTNFILFVTMGPNRSENFKTLLLLQIAAKSFETCTEFPPNGPYKNTFGIFEILSF